jgi:hypothetical protein
MPDPRNRPDSKDAPDDWLTPPRLLQEAGHERGFDLDPACCPRMPWATADRMVSIGSRNPGKTTLVTTGNKKGPYTWAERGDGLAIAWHGRVWLNPPYSDILPWAERMAAHGNGLLLVPAKSTDSKWGQRVLAGADEVLWIAGRLLFHYPSGKPSTGKWAPSLLASFTSGGADDASNRLSLRRVQRLYGGVITKRSGL